MCKNRLQVDQKIREVNLMQKKHRIRRIRRMTKNSKSHRKLLSSQKKKKLSMTMK